MEEKQLDFNAPLLSVRRFSSTMASSEGKDSKRIDNSQPKIPSLPFYKPELKSGPVRYPGAVPFLWEQTPGRPKDGDGRRPRSLERSPFAPKLPPGRVLDLKQQSSNRESEDSSVVRLQSNNVFPSSQKVLSLDDNVTKLESSKEGVKEKGDADTEDDDDEAFTDALDTLSRTESFFFNCSVSGLNGFDCADIKPSGTFSTDPQTRDFMMGRFLPAAKAVASETPQYASRKQPLAREQPTQVTKAVNRDRRPPVYQYRPNMITKYALDKGEEESEDEDDDDDYYDTGNLSAKACGLFPRLCLRNSICIINPVPGMKVRPRMPVSSVRKVRTQVKTAYTGSHSATGDEQTWDTVYKHKLVSELQPSSLIEDESKLINEPNQIPYWSNSQMPDGSSPSSRSGVGGISPYRNEAPPSPFHKGLFLGIPKEIKNYKDNGFESCNKGHKSFREILSHQSSQQGSGSLSPVVEKTLYVDSVHMVETPNSNSRSSYAGLVDITNKDSEILVGCRGTEEILAVKSFVRDINNMKSSKERDIIQPKFLEVKTDLTPSSGRSNLGGHMDRTEGFRQDGGLDQESRLVVCSKMSTDGSLDFDNAKPLKEDDQGNSFVSSLHSPLPPPLPKSPSESWLCRTLPSISSKNPSLRSYQGTQFHLRKQAHKTSSINPKWETIVKTSNVSHARLQFSEELTSVSQQSKTYK